MYEIISLYERISVDFAVAQFVKRTKIQILV